MTIDILYEDRFGIEQKAGVLISTSETDGELYELLGIKLAIVNVAQELARVEHELNVDKREGYAIYPILDSYEDYVWYHHPKGLVLCLARGIWG